MNKTILISAILGAATLGSAQNFFNISVSPTETAVDNLNVLLRLDQEGSIFGVAIPLSQSAAVGTTSNFEFGTNVPLSTLKYGVLATHGNDGVTIGVSTLVANALIGQTWESVFTNPLFSKAAVRQAVTSNNFGFNLLFADYLANLEVNVAGQNRGLLADLGSQTVLLNFSTARANGSASLQPVPEPASMTALALGAAALLRRRRKA